MLRLLQSEPKDLPLLKPERTPLPPSKDSLSPQQKILTSPVAAKAIDWLSGGASLPDAQQYAGQQVENIKNIPKVIPALNPFTPLDKQEKALEAFSTPLETISRVPTALQKLAFPTEGQGRLESAVKALIRPDKVPPGYLGGEISKAMPPPKKEVSMLSPRVLVPGLAGAAGEILSFELGLGTMFSRLAKGYQSAKMRGASKDMDNLLNEATKKAVEVGESKGAYPKDWNLADKFGRTKAELQKRFETNPELGDALMKRQTPTKIFTEGLMNKRGAAEIPNPKPKPKDLIAPAEAGIKNIADLSPKDNIVRDEQGEPVEIRAQQKTPTQIEMDKLLRNAPTTPPPGERFLQQGSALPPPEPPKTTFNQPEPEDDFFGKEKEADLLKQFNQELSSITDKLKKSISGKIQRSLKGGEEESLIPQQLFSSKKGQTLDELAQENTEDLMALGYEANDEGLRQFIQDSYGQISEESQASQRARISQASARDDLRKMVSQIDKKLSRSLPAGKVKPTVTLSTGVQKPKKPTTIEESKLLKLRLQQQAKGSRAGFSEGKAQGRGEEKERVQDVLKKKKTRKELSDSIKKKIKFIKEASTKDIPIEYKDMIEEIKRSVDFENVGLKKILSKEKIHKNLEEEGLIKQVNDLSNITARDMNLEELDLVYDTIERLYHEGYNANRFLSVKSENNFNAAVFKGSQSIESSGGIPKVPTIEKKPASWHDKPRHIKSKYIAENRRPEAVIESFDKYKENGVNYNVMFKPLNDAANLKLDNIEKTSKVIGKIFKDVNIAEALGKRVKIKGIKRPLLRDEMLFIYANTFNDFNLQHILGSGVSEESIHDVEKKLKPEEKKAVKDLIKYYDEVQYDRLDAVYSNLKGRHVKKEENYFPIMGLENVGDMEAIEMSVDQRAGFLATGIPQSMTKERVGGAKAYKTFSFFKTVYRNINQVEHYISHAEAVRDVSKYLKNIYIADAIRDNYGEPIYNMLDKWVADVARGRDENFGKFYDDFVVALRANYVLYALGANLSTVVKQPASFIQGAEYIGKQWALGALVEFAKNPQKMIKEVRAASSQMKHRRFSQERELQELLKGRGIAKKFNQKDYHEILQMIREGSMMPIMWADQMTVTVLWKGAYNRKMSEFGDEEKAKDFADKAIRRTQPQARLVDLPEMFRADPMRKMFTVFKNQPNQNFNLLYDSYLKFKQAGGEAGSFKKFSSEIFFYLVVSGLFFSVLMRRRAPKDKGEVAWSLANQALGGLPLISEVLSSIEYPWGTGTFIESLIKDAARIITSKKASQKAKYATETAAKTFGIPGYVAAKRLLTREDLKTRLLGGEREKKSKSKNRLKTLRLLDGAGSPARAKGLRLLQ